jgi:hypothetical protein
MPPGSDADRLRRARFTAQLLGGSPARTPAQAASQLLALQAQDLRAARLAVRARTRGLTAADVNRALDERSVVIGWLFRGTLHMVQPDDYGWLLALTAPTQQQAVARRLQQLGYPPARADRAVRLIERALGDGPQTRAALRERLGARGFDGDGQELVHLLFRSSLRGRSLRGPLVGGAQTFVLCRDWLGVEPNAAATGERRQRALAELARRYLRGHGPAAPVDLAWWAGLPLGDARRAFAAIAGELREWPGGVAELDGPRRRPPAPRPRLLGAFDEFVLGWRDAGFSVPERQLRRVRDGGWIRPVALIGGRAAGVWKAPRAGRRLALEIDYWQPPQPADAEALAAEAADVARFEGAELR